MYTMVLRDVDYYFHAICTHSADFAVAILMSVCPSRAAIVWKRLHVSLAVFHCRVGTLF